MKLFLLYTSLLLSTTTLYAQVGIGTATPKAYLNVPIARTVLFGTDTTGIKKSDNPNEYEPKLIWYSSKGAFRAGGINIGGIGYGSTDGWDNASVGNYSFASGVATIASGRYATAMGYQTTATGDYAFSTGAVTIASGIYSTALGLQTNATGDVSTAMGLQTTADGYHATAMGYSCSASGTNAIAMGYTNVASGDYSTAVGNYASTNSKAGSFIIGDYGTTTKYQNSATNQMMMRFSGGYVLYSNAPQSQSLAVGVKLASGGNAWQTISDSSRKENFRYADGASFLQKISQMRLGSWNYKGQDVRVYRHYGPMAQDFFAAFGQDELGVIGENKSINQADFDGVNLIAIQALIHKVEKLEAELALAKAKEINTQSRLDIVETILVHQASASVTTAKP